MLAEIKSQMSNFAGPGLYSNGNNYLTNRPFNHFDELCNNN